MQRSEAVCFYEDHRRFDWSMEDSARWVCGKCHPVPGWPVTRLSDRQEGFLDRKGFFVAVLRPDPSERAHTVAVRPESVPAVAPHVVGLPTPATISLAKAQALFERWRKEEYGWVRARILTLARIHGEYHADMMIGVELQSPNIIGAAVGGLGNQGLLEKLNRSGVEEHRKTVSATSRRASFVWRLTPKGYGYALRLRKELGNTDRLPGPKRATTGPSGVLSRDGRHEQFVISDDGPTPDSAIYL